MPLDETEASSITSRYDELMSSLSDPAVVSDQDRYLNLSKELAEITPKAQAVKRYFDAKEEVSEAL